MEKNLIPEELNALIQQYLTDGVLTDKERQVILNKAEKMGLDSDEIDLYLDAEVQKIDQAIDATVRRQKGKQCPHCGAYVSLMTDKCPECEQFITPEATKELTEILENLEEALVNLKSAKDIPTSKATVERYARKAKMYYGNHPKIQKLLPEIEEEMMLAEKELKNKALKNSLTSFSVKLFKNPFTWTILIAISSFILNKLGERLWSELLIIATIFAAFFSLGIVLPKADKREADSRDSRSS